MASHSCLLSCDKLDVRQLPSFVEQSLFRAVEAEEHFKFSAWVRRHPVRILARRLGDHSADPVFTSKRTIEGLGPMPQRCQIPTGRPVVVTRTKNNYSCGL